MKAMPPKTTALAITEAFEAIALATSYRIVWMALSTWLNMSARLGGVLNQRHQNLKATSTFIYPDGDVMPQKLQYNTSVEKSLANLRAMGLRVQLMPENENEVYLFIDLESLLNIISRRVPYPQKKVYYEKPFIVVYLWRG